MFKVGVATLGCKVNQCESAVISEALASQEVALVSFDEQADCYIINTCTVTGKTDYQSRQLIRRAIRRNPSAAVIVTGCYAQRAPEEIARIPGVRMIAGNSEKSSLPKLIREMAETKGLEIRVGDMRRETRLPPADAATFPGHTRAFLKIQDGCDAFCSYCIVPLARGTNRSLPPADIEDRIAALATRGYREVVLTGIHLGAYGRDLSSPSDLAEIVRRIAQSRSVERLRLSSIEPREVSDELITLIGSSGIVCRHLHIPLQSGDDRILTAMNRDYDAGFFRDLVWKIHAAVPGIAVGTDIIAGFPGESEAAFTNTLRLVEGLPIAYLHVFPYSRRPGTPAAAMPDQISEPEKKRRVEELRGIGAVKRQSFAEGCIGTPLTVLIEERKKKQTGFSLGFSDNYIPTACRGAYEANRILRVMPASFQDGHLVGEVIHE